MTKRNRSFNAPTLDPATFARRLWEELHPMWGLINGLVQLRDLSDAEASAAIEAILGVPTVRRIRLSWELWDMLVIGDGHDPDELLAEFIRLDVVDILRRALWGDSVVPSNRSA